MTSMADAESAEASQMAPAVGARRHARKRGGAKGSEEERSGAHSRPRLRHGR